MASSPLLNQIINRNFLSTSAFKFILSQNRKIDFFCSEINIPRINLGVAIQPTYLKDIPIPGDKLTYDDLSLKFIVDENMENYITIHNWMRGLGYPENVYEYQELLNEDEVNPGKQTAYSGQSDGELIIYNSNFNPVSKVIFKGLFPTYLSTISFTSQTNDSNYIIAEATFKYTSYDLITSQEPLDIKIIPKDPNIICISVVDENTRISSENMEIRWNNFRENWPNRKFYLLQPSTCTDTDVLRTPVSFLEETDPTTITNLCVSPVINGFDDEKFGAYRSTSERIVEVAPLNNIIRETSFDNIEKYGVFRIGLEQACGDLSDIITLLQNNATLTKVLNYINSGGVLWLNSEWVGGGCANHPNTNTILNLLGSSIDIIGDTGTIGYMQRSNVQEVIDAGFPEQLYHNASGIFSGGIPIYDYGTSILGIKRNTFVYERIGKGILTVSADVNTYTNPNNPYTLLPPQELYTAFRNLVLN